VATAIFLSYRRDDAQGWAGHLGEALAAAFGAAPVFLDLRSIPPGADFVDAIESTLASAAVVLALVGPRWLSATGADARRRLDAPDDLVRLELATALRRGVPVIPLLLGGARMPAATELPPDLAALARRQALEVSDARWEHDVAALVPAIAARSGLRPSPSSPPGEAGAVSVGEDLTLDRAAVGDVVGVDAEGTAAGATGPVDVARRAVIRGSTTGDLVGVRVRSRDGGERS
jgi:hypothetical protein